MSVGANIKRLRLEAGLTQEELAQRIGVARSTVTQWERGWTQPRMGMVHKLAVFFGTTNSVIVEESGADRNAASGGSATPCFIPLHQASGECDVDSCAKLDIPAIILSKHPGAHAVVVGDDGMNRVLPKGFAAVYDPILMPQNGQIVVVKDEDGRLLLRRWHRGNSTVMLAADSYEPWKDIILTDKCEIEVLGVVFHAQTVNELA